MVFTGNRCPGNTGRCRKAHILPLCRRISMSRPRRPSVIIPGSRGGGPPIFFIIWQNVVSADGRFAGNGERRKSSAAGRGMGEIVWLAWKHCGVFAVRAYRQWLTECRRQTGFAVSRGIFSSTTLFGKLSWSRPQGGWGRGLFFWI